MIYLAILTFLTYFQVFFNEFISDDLAVKDRWEKKEMRHKDFNYYLWMLIKDNRFLHYLVTVSLYTVFILSLYVVGCKFLPQNVAFLATALFCVHPCNTQLGGWISGKLYVLSGICALWAVYFANPLLYFLSGYFAVGFYTLPLIMKIPLWAMPILLIIGYYIQRRILRCKYARLHESGEEFHGERTQLYPRKIVVAVKSFAYYFILAVIPIRSSWHHAIGDPINDKLKSFDKDFWLSLLLIAGLFLFWGTPAFIGLVIFAIGIAPFTNIITFGCFIAERYMAFALIGWSIFLAYTLVSYPFLAIIVLTAYFMRTQLNLWSYKSDLRIALTTLLIHPTSGYGWISLITFFLLNNQVAIAHVLLKVAMRYRPDYSVLHYQRAEIYKKINQPQAAIMCLRKAYELTPYEGWKKEADRLEKYLQKG